jgi:3'-phosphoadenosine 5'-phosphosulfate sulfotransferase
MFKLLPGEKEILNIDPAKILMYKWFTGSYYWTKKIKITNKRIIISFSWFGIESFNGGISCFLNKKDYDTYKKYGDSIIIKHELGKGKIIGDYIKLVTKQGFLSINTKIYSQSHQIEEIIKKNSK